MPTISTPEGAMEVTVEQAEIFLNSGQRPVPNSFIQSIKAGKLVGDNQANKMINAEKPWYQDWELQSARETFMNVPVVSTSPEPEVILQISPVEPPVVTAQFTTRAPEEMPWNPDIAKAELLAQKELLRTHVSKNDINEHIEMIKRSPLPSGYVPHSPLPGSLSIQKSPIEGNGLFANEFIPSWKVLGVTHIKTDIDHIAELQRTAIGSYLNHSKTPNCILVKRKNAYLLCTTDQIFVGDELTLDYEKEDCIS